MDKQITVDQKANWKLYITTLPAQFEALGTVTRDGYDTGALARNKTTGLYMQFNAGVMRSLDGRQVAAALGLSGRPKEINGGRKVSVYLDQDTIDRAEKLGNGSISEGIRRAVNHNFPSLTAAR